MLSDLSAGRCVLAFVESSEGVERALRSVSSEGHGGAGETPAFFACAQVVSYRLPLIAGRRVHTVYLKRLGGAAPVVDVEVSFDKLSIVGTWVDWEGVSVALGRWVSTDPENVRVSEYRRSWQDGSDRTTISWMLDGAHVSGQFELSTLAYRQIPVDDTARIEWNPNKATDRVRLLVSMFEKSRVTRADVALDYSGIRPGDFVWRRARVKSAVHLGRGAGGAVETVYLGSRVSPRFVRIYDKALELGVVGCLTRCEGVGRYKHALSEGLFDGVEAHAPAVPEGLSVADSGLLALHWSYPAALAAADKRTRARAVQLARATCEPLRPSPASVYRGRMSYLKEGLAELVSGGAWHRAAVYGG